MLKAISSITNAIGALNYKGTWDANANSPALTSSVGTKGDYYVVGTAGSTNLNGISNWGVGDWAAFNGSVWQRVEGGANLNGVDLSVSGTSTLSGLTASTALALNASKEIVSVTNTGTGDNVLATSPTLVTPALGAATATSINKVALTAPATAATLTIANGKTLTANHSLTLAGTDATTMTFPTTSATIARTDAGQTFTGTQTINGSSGSDVLTLIRNNGGVTTGRCLVLDSVNDAHLNYAGIKFNTGGTNRGAIIQETTGNIYFDAGNDLLLRPVGNLVSDRVYNVTVGATNRDVFVDNTGVLGYVTSIRESKANIENISDVSWLLDLNPVTFNYREKNKDGSYTDNVTDALEYGLIAEDTEQVNPELCFYDVVDGQMKLRGVSYSKLVTPMLKLMQDQQKTINELQKRLADLINQPR